MNIVEQYDANNTYYSLEVVATKAVQGMRFETVDNAIYKTKVDFGDGVTKNGTGVVGSSSSVGTSTKNYSEAYTGKIRISNNPKKVKKIVLDFGIDGSSADPDFLNVKNVVLAPDILDHFNEAEYFYFSHYCYGSVNTALQGKVTGEWSGICGNNLKSLELVNCDYPLSDPTFNMNLMPKDSVLEVLKLGSGYSVASSYVSVSGDLENIPSTCKVVYLGGDRPGTSNNVAGIIPNWVEEFSRIGRNTIYGNVSDFSPNLRYINVQGSNTLSGNLSNMPFLKYINISGNNTVGGNLNNILNVEQCILSGQNIVSGSIPNFPNCNYLSVSGNNSLSGSVPSIASLTLMFAIHGNNTIEGALNLPNISLVSISGQNKIASLNLPKVTSVIISGQNIISGDLSAQINQSATNIQITGQNLLSSVSNVFPDATTFIVTGKNLLTGNILDKCPKATSIQIGGENTITYTTRTFPSTMSVLEITGKAALTQQMVDRLLSDLNRDVSIWNGSKKITIKGNSEPPSSDSLSARNSLVLKGVTISTN